MFYIIYDKNRYAPYYWRYNNKKYNNGKLEKKVIKNKTEKYEQDIFGIDALGYGI